MITLASIVAVILYVFPLAIVFWVRARATRTLSSIALDIPVTIAADMLLVLSLCFALRLDFAVIASRILWVVGGAAAVLLSPVPRRFPFALRHTWGAAGLSTLAAAALSMLISRPYSAWDRTWHIPLVASLRGQTLPFHNVFHHAEPLHYHFSGDVQAAMVQTLSGGRIHSALALSVAHDIMFGLSGLTLALLLLGMNIRSIPKVLFIVLAVLLAGPLTLGREATTESTEGYNFVHFLTMSFRPHDAPAGLFMIGFVGVLVSRVYRRWSISSLEGICALFFITAGSAISDETSIGMLGLALGLAWLIHPAFIDPKRSVGVFAFALLLVALILPNIVFSASLSPGAQRHAFSIVPWRSPGFATATMSLTDPAAPRRLLFDLAPMLLVWLASALSWASQRKRNNLGLLLFHTALLTTSVLALTRVDVNGSAWESHRFVTAIVLVSPLLGLTSLLICRDDYRLRWAFILHKLGWWAWLLGTACAMASTGDWIVRLAPKKMPRPTHYHSAENHYHIDCRRDMGATWGTPSRYTYMPRTSWYLYAGCQPLVAPAWPHRGGWTLTTDNPMFDVAAFRELNRRLPPTEDLPVICPNSLRLSSSDPVCTWAQSAKACQSLSRRLDQCVLSHAQRQEALKVLQGTTNKNR